MTSWLYLAFSPSSLASPSIQDLLTSNGIDLSRLDQTVANLTYYTSAQFIVDVSGKVAVWICVCACAWQRCGGWKALLCSCRSDMFLACFKAPNLSRMPDNLPWHCMQSFHPAFLSSSVIWWTCKRKGYITSQPAMLPLPAHPLLVVLPPVLPQGPLLALPALYPQVYDWVDFQKNQSVWRPSRPSLNSSLGSTVPWLGAAAFMGMVPEEAGEYLALTVWQHAHANAVPDPQVRRCSGCRSP